MTKKRLAAPLVLLCALLTAAHSLGAAAVQVFVDDRGQNGLLVTRSPEPVFNGALREAKLPLSEN